MILLDTYFVPDPNPTKGDSSPSFPSDNRGVTKYIDSIRSKINRVKRWMSDELPVVEVDLLKLESMLEKKDPHTEEKTVLSNSDTHGTSNSQSDIDWENIDIE